MILLWCMLPLKHVAFIHKPASVFLWSPGMLHPGQEGMCYACCRYGMGQELFSNEDARGGSAWGAGTLANGDGSRQPSKLELDLAEYQVCHPS